jgi:hypothetical protein
MIIPMTTTRTKVLAVIKWKEFVQYLSHMKSNTNIKNSNKFCLFHYDNGHDTKKCYALKKKDKMINH